MTSNQTQPRASFDQNGIVTSPGYVTLYGFDPATGLYQGSGEEFRPAWQGIPAGSTLLSPQQPDSGQAAVFDQNAQHWSLVESHVGQTVWLKADGQAVQITSPGPLPDTVVTTAPPGPYYRWDGQTNAWALDTTARSAALKTQAATALEQARTAIWNNYGILGEDTPADCVAYLRTLMAISNGADTTSTALPAAPAGLD